VPPPRLQNQFSAFGAFLDPVDDKLMVAAALILLCTQPIAAGPLAGNAWLIPALTLGEEARRLAAGEGVWHGWGCLGRFRVVSARWQRPLWRPPQAGEAG
jgi:phosphatidylglycerophosphate synthase